MTKTLTEQWREGTLPDAEYYVKNKSNVVVVDYYCELTKSFATIFPCNVKEVLAPVPSYDKVKEMSQKIERLEFDNEALEMAHNEGKEINDELVSKNEQLEKKLEIATKALEKYAETETHDWIDSQVVSKRALKEMECVK